MLHELHAPDELGRMLRQARRRQRLTLSDVALSAGTGVRFVSELERGKATAELGKALRVLEVVGMRMWVEAEGLDEGA